MAQITTVDQLRHVLGHPRDATKAKILPEIDTQGRAFIARSPFLMMATRDASGRLEVSPKGDEPGFVRVESPTTLLMPERAGNRLAFGLTGLIETGDIALNFLLPGTSETLRVSGTATIHDDADVLATLGTAERPALLAIRVQVQHSYFHCARAMLRSQVWQPDTWGERMKISFGSIIAPRIGGDAAMAKTMDETFEGFMKTNVWKNP